MRRPRYRPRPALGSVTFPAVVSVAVAVAIGAVLLQLLPKRQPSYRGF